MVLGGKNVQKGKRQRELGGREWSSSRMRWEGNERVTESQIRRGFGGEECVY